MINKKIFKSFVLTFVLAVFTGCQRDMEDRGKLRPLEQDHFFSNGSSARQEIEGTVSVNDLKTDSTFFTGKEKDGGYAADIAIKVDKTIIKEGKEKYAIYCLVCHGAGGGGDGVVVQKGFTKPLSFNAEKLRNALPGYYFYVMTNGYGTMDYFRDVLNEYERWAITAYIREIIGNSSKTSQK
jgi:mono/diheme cytochrome c family protein